MNSASAGDGAFAIGERVLDFLMQCSVDETAAAIGYVIRHHAIHAELTGGDDCAIGWLAAVRAAVDAAENKLGEYIERDAMPEERKAEALAEVKALLAQIDAEQAEQKRRAA